MTPYKGIVKHDPANGEWGDCLRTAIGCLLDMPPDQVPHFAKRGDAETDEIVAERVERWLRRRGLCRITLYLPGTYTPEDACRNLGLMNPGIPYLFSGRSKIGSNHTVIARDGKIIHDPSPLDTGIVGPMDNDFYMIEFLGAKLTGDRAINANQPAAPVSGATEAMTNPRLCDTCHGESEVECSFCGDGAGYDADDKCPKCGGVGCVACPACDGKTRTPEKGGSNG